MRRLPTLIAKSIIDEASKASATTKFVDISNKELYSRTINLRTYASSIPCLFDHLITLSTATTAPTPPPLHIRSFSSSTPSLSDTAEKRPRRARPGSGWSDQPRSTPSTDSSQSHHQRQTSLNRDRNSSFPRQSSSSNNDLQQGRRRYPNDSEHRNNQRTNYNNNNRNNTRQSPRTSSFDNNSNNINNNNHPPPSPHVYDDDGYSSPSSPSSRRDPRSKWSSPSPSHSNHRGGSNNTNTNYSAGRNRNERDTNRYRSSSYNNNEQRKNNYNNQQKNTSGTSKTKTVVVPTIDEVKIPHDVTVVKLAHILNISVKDLEKILSDLGDPPRSTEDSVSSDSAELAALELGKTAILLPAPSLEKRKKIINTDDDSTDTDTTTTSLSSSLQLQPRPAVITVMGHVDHGKTTLLDALRSTTVAAREAGGITQHVGAFEVIMPGSKQSLTFLDTPGHAAFGAMRARGAAVTDLVVLVVAADDGVMPQTREALAHARASKCPIVVAITKCDVPAANPDKVRKQLLAEGLLLEGMGGEVQSVEVAATKGQGLAELEEALLLEGEMLELKADPSIRALGTVVEAKVARGLGPVATVIVRDGTLKAGDAVVVGCEWGKIKALKNPDGVTLGAEGVGPGRPAEVIGLKGLPLAGDELMVVASEERAQRISRARTNRSNDSRHAAAAAAVISANGKEEKKAVGTAKTRNGRRAGSQSQPSDTIDKDENQEQGPKMLPIVVKADVQGSAEAVKEAIEGLSTDAVRVHVVHAGVGPITQSDVALAVPFDAAVIGFNVRPAADAESSAKSSNVRIVSRRIIYELLEDVSAMVEGASPKEAVDVVVGSAEVLAVFKVPGSGSGQPSRMVAGCRVVDGSVKSGLKMRVLRGGDVVYEGVCDTLKRHKLVVNVVGKGTECGVGMEGFDGFELGDVLQSVDQQ